MLRSPWEHSLRSSVSAPEQKMKKRCSMIVFFLSRRLLERDCHGIVTPGTGKVLEGPWTFDPRDSMVGSDISGIGLSLYGFLNVLEHGIDRGIATKKRQQM